MASESYGCLGGVEIWNQCRVATYAGNGWRAHGSTVKGCGCCGPNLAAALEDDPYVDPVTDEAPWYSASEPHSGDFGGFLVTSITGLEPGQITRSSTQRANGRGSLLGPEVQASPQIVVSGILIGKTCCSVGYGLRWLRTVLRGSCGSDCGGDDLTFLDCCPPDDCTTPECLTPYVRTMKGVQLVSSPQITARLGGCCGSCKGSSALQVSFVLEASAPCVYRDPVVVITDQTWDLTGTPECNIDWVFIREGDECPAEVECAEIADCLSDPDCAGGQAPPAPPPPSNPCICIPHEIASTCMNIPAGTIPEYTEGMLVATVKSGSKDMRQVRVRIWNNPLQQPLEDLDPCNTCGEVTLSWIPANSTFTFDGQTRKATITCGGRGGFDATPLMGSVGGSLPIQWPEIACASSAFTVCVEADRGTIAPDASVSLSVVAAECS